MFLMFSVESSNDFDSIEMDFESKIEFSEFMSNNYESHFRRELPVSFLNEEGEAVVTTKSLLEEAIDILWDKCGYSEEY